MRKDVQVRPGARVQQIFCDGCLNNRGRFFAYRAGAGILLICPECGLIPEEGIAGLAQARKASIGQRPEGDGAAGVSQGVHESVASGPSQGGEGR